MAPRARGLYEWGFDNSQDVHDTGIRPRPLEKEITKVMQETDLAAEARDSKLRLDLARRMFDDPYFAEKNAEISVAVAQLIFHAQKTGATMESFNRFLQMLKEGDGKRKTEPLNILLHLSSWLGPKSLIRPGDFRVWKVMDASPSRLMQEKPSIIARLAGVQNADISLFEVMNSELKA